MLVRIYEQHCPHCQTKHSVGFDSAGTWWESRCTYRRCKQFFHFGQYPPNTPDRGTTIELRCPNPNCGKKYIHGQFMQATWLEMKCGRCHEFFHYGPLGRGPVAVMRPYDLQSLSPEPQGANVRAILLDKLPDWLDPRSISWN